MSTKQTHLPLPELPPPKVNDLANTNGDVTHEVWGAGNGSTPSSPTLPSANMIFSPDKTGTSVEFDKDVGMMSPSGHTNAPNTPKKTNLSDSAGGSGFNYVEEGMVDEPNTAFNSSLPSKFPSAQPEKITCMTNHNEEGWQCWRRFGVNNCKRQWLRILFAFVYLIITTLAWMTTTSQTNSVSNTKWWDSVATINGGGRSGFGGLKWALWMHTWCISIGTRRMILCWSTITKILWKHQQKHGLTPSTTGLLGTTSISNT